MKKFVTKVSVLALFVAVGLTACKDDDAKASCQSGTFEMTVNGDVVTPKSFNNTLVKGNSGGTDAKRMDIRATDANGRQLIITFNDLSTGTVGDGVSTGEYIPFAELETGTENLFLFTIIDGNVSYSFIEGNLDITSCDAEAKQISGTFSFANEDFEVTSGSFTNMCYTVMAQ